MISSLLAAEVPPRRSWFNILLREIEVAVQRVVMSPPRESLPRRLNLGCGEFFVPGWTNCDFATARSLVRGKRWPDWNMDASRRWRCPDAHFDVIHCEHVLEHFPYHGSIHVVRECMRTLRSGGVLRVVLPDLRKFCDYYLGRQSDPAFVQFQAGVVAMSKLTQCDFHLSVWDQETLIQVLQEVGFENVRERSFGEGIQPADIIDRPERAWESLYVEAIKP